MGVTYNKKLIKKDRAVSGHGPRDLQNQQLKRNVPIPVGGDTDLIKSLQQQITVLTEQLNKAPAQRDGLYTEDQVNDEILKAIKAETAQLKLDHERELQELKVEAIHLGNKANNLIEQNEKLTTKLKLVQAEVEERVSKLSNEVKSEYDKLLDARDSKIEGMEKDHRIELSTLRDKIANQEDIIATLRQSQGSSSTSNEGLEKLLADATSKMERMAASMGNPEYMADPDRPQMETTFVDPLETDAKELEHKIIVEDVSPKKKEDMANKVNKLRNLMGKLPEKRPV